MCHVNSTGRPLSSKVRRQDVTIPLSTKETLPCKLYKSTTGESKGGIILLYDIYGMTPFYMSLCDLLAEKGFSVLIPDCFFRQGNLKEVTRDEAFARRNQVDDIQVLRDLNDAIDWFKLELGNVEDNIGIIGFCIGGTYALNLASEREDLAVVSYYGFPAGVPGSPNPAPVPFDVVEKITGPILAFWGDQDYIVKMDDVNKFKGLMEKYDVAYEQVIYPGVGHGFLAGLTDETENNRKDAIESWDRSIRFLDKHVATMSMK